MNTRFLLVLLVLIAAFSAGARGDKLTDPEVARQLGVSVPQLHSLRDQYRLSNDQLLAMAADRFQILVTDLSHPGFRRRAEEQNFRALRMRDENGNIDPDGLLRALEHRRHHHHHDGGTESDLFPVPPDPSTNGPTFGTSGPLIAGIQTNSWTWLGPGNIGGRVRAIVPHPTITNILWCGGVDGGIWKTTNSGTAWFPLNDFMGNLAVASLVIDPTNASILYAGTGEPTYNIDSIRGAGIYKSLDGGSNWFQLSGTTSSSFQYVGRLAIDPNNSQVILAATRSGIWRSTNGGTNWTQRLATEVLCIAFHPTDSLQAIASGYNGVARYSTDGGLTWLSSSGIPVVSGFVVDRVELGYSRSNPSIVYASVDNSSGQVYRSTDAGHTFTLRNTGNSFLSGQGWYDNLIWADPVNTNTLMVGGTDVWRSTDGGATFVDIGGYSGSIHPDQHVIVAHPLFNGTTIRTIYLGNDGGMFRATDAYAASSSSGWANLNHNLGITQFYGAAGNSNSLVIVGGTQDNGTLRYTTGGGPQGWTAMFGGDGGICAADQTNPNYFYGEYVDLQIHRSANGGASSSYIYSGITDAGGGSVNFISPFILDLNNPNTMLAGGASLWRSTNVKAATPSWSAIKPSIGSPISAIAVAPGNSDVIWVGHNSGAVYVTANGTAATPTWTLRNGGLPARYCTSFAVSPNPGRAYVTFGGYNAGNVWQTSNSGASWINIGASLPSAPMNSIVIAPTDTNTLYVGSDVGVYGTSNNGGAWSTGNDGPANVAVDQVFWLGPKLIAVTHGRGVFSITPALGPPILAPAGFTLLDGNTNGSVDPNECSQLLLYIQNTNGATATNISAVLTTTTPGVSIAQPASAYPSVSLNSVVTNLTPFRISTSSSFPCGTAVSLTLTLTSNGTTNVLSYTLPSSGTYVFTQTNGAAIIPGIADTGNHGDNTVTTVTLPFPVTFCGRSFTNATLCSNGNLQFLSSNIASGNICLPAGGLNYTICPFWTDLRTDLAGEGIFISTIGTAPNRVFAIEWRAELVSSSASVNFEILFYESQARFDIIYGALSDPGTTATVGIQSDTGSAFTNFECNVGGLSAGLQLSYLWQCNDGGGQCAPVPNFVAGPTSGPVPLTVFFTNLSLVATNYAWDFGDGNTSSAVNPVNTYTQAGIYTVTLTVAGPGGTVPFTRSNYILVTNVPPTIIGPPLGQTVPRGVLASFNVNATGTTPLAYQWRFAGVPISGATGTNYSIASAQCADAGPYDVVVTNIGGSITSTVALLSVQSPPFITLQPTNITLLVGARLDLFVTATNDCGGGLSYQWMRQGTNIPGATFTVFARVNAQLTDAGSYQLVVANLAGSVTSAVAVVTVLAPPTISTPPSSLSVAASSNATFTVSAAGTAPLAFQWRFAGAPVAGATDTSYTRTNAQCADAGNYDVVITNSVGSITSAVATLTVVAPPVITGQPTNLTVAVGQTATFQVVATNDCGGGLSYQWLRSATNLTNATNSSLVIPGAQLSDSGNYSVLVTNLAGSLTSSVATLTVVLPAQLVITPPALDFGLILTGATAKASFVVSNSGGIQLTGSATISGGPFVFTDGSTGLLLVPAFSSTNVTIGFSPVVSGAFSNTVAFASNGGNSTNAITGAAVNTFAPTILSPAFAGGNFTFSFQSIASKTYVVQYKDNLQNVAWLTLQTIPGDGTLKSVITPVSSSPQRFYRLSVQ